MLGEYTAGNDIDEAGTPTGGFVMGTGLNIAWQSGALGLDGERLEPNGAFVETVLDAVRQRLKFFQEASDGKFACDENEKAIGHIEKALMFLDARTMRRESQGIEGTHTPDPK